MRISTETVYFFINFAAMTLATCNETHVLTREKNCSSLVKRDFSDLAKAFSDLLDTYEEMRGSREFSEESASVMTQAQVILAGKIDKFTTSLKSFIHETRFDVRGFELKGKSLSRQLSQLRVQVNDQSPSVEFILSLFFFAEHMFDTMSGSIELLKFYENTSVPCNNLVWLVIELNVRLLGLFNAVGAADVEKSHYSKKVNIHKGFLNFLKKGFDDFDSVPYGTYRMFLTQFEEAKRTLKILTKPKRGARESDADEILWE